MEFEARRSKSIVCVCLFVCLFVYSHVNLAGQTRCCWDFCVLPPSIMAQGPPSSDSEDPDGIREYQYESEGEEALSRRAQSLFHEAGQDYRRKSIQDYVSRT